MEQRDPGARPPRNHLTFNDMPDQQHSPEPWQISDEYDGMAEIASAENQLIVNGDTYPEGWCKSADARRIVACVNLLRGISTEELERRTSIKSHQVSAPGGKIATEWAIWSEGAAFNEGIYPAIFHGLQRAETFNEACKAFFQNHRDKQTRDYFNAERMTWWGCRLFDNETEARKFVG